MSGGKDMPAKGRSLPERVEDVLVEHDCLQHAHMGWQVVNDVKKVGWEKAKYFVSNFSPSQLGKRDLIGLRRLAKIRRDRPEVFNEVMKELEGIFGGAE